MAARKGRVRGSGDPGMGIELDPADDRSWEVVRTYASWSIHVELTADAEAYQVIASLHDCGYSVTAELTTDEAAEVRRKLDNSVPVVPLHETRERDEAERTTAKENNGPSESNGFQDSSDAPSCRQTSENDALGALLPIG